MYELKKLVAFWKQPGSMLNDDFRFNVGTGCFYEYDANARTKAVSLFSTVAAYAITRVLGPFDTTCIANQHCCLPD